ncbi:hypothetical protein HDU79_008124 [Rhizoclosmatium sp. JEL0117]|nr:hypothetical protein HDU79_008124 [Rhizoclosmatium sp. JEL0117]
MKGVLILLLSANALAADFAWGFGGSSYQTEGAWNVGGKEPNVYDQWYHSAAHASEANADVTVDQYHRYKDDLKLLPTLDATLYRFSVSWSRVMHNCTGMPNEEGIAFYGSMIDEIIKNGAVPFLTMFHWDLPQACYDQFQGFNNDKIIPAFMQYATVLFNAYGDRVKYWLTVNEAESNCKFGYQQGRLAPGLVQASYQATIDCVARTQKLHAAVVKMARTGNFNGYEKVWKFGFPSNVDWYETGSVFSASVAANRNLARAGWYHDPLVFGDYKQDVIDAFLVEPDNADAMGTPPPAFSDADKLVLAGTVDFIAMNYYSTSGIPVSAEEVPSGAGCPLFCWQHVYSKGLREMANWYYNRYNLDIILTEVGYAAPDEATLPLDQVINNPNRLAFWKTHLQAISDAIEIDKLPIKGLLIWSLTDNFEWGYYDQKFGAVYIEGLGVAGASLNRIVKNSTYFVADYFRGKKYNNPFVAGNKQGGVNATGAPSISGVATVTKSGAVAQVGAGLLGVLSLVFTVL